MSWLTIKNYIATKIFANGSNQITPALHRDALNTLVDQLFESFPKGCIDDFDATPSDLGIVDDRPLWWLAKKGNYPNLGFTITKDVAIVMYRNTFVKSEIDIGVYSKVNLTPIASAPPQTGNVTNLNSFVTYGNTSYFIDQLGNSVLLGVSIPDDIVIEVSTPGVNLDIGIPESTRIRVNIRGQRFRIVDTAVNSQEVSRSGTVITTPTNRPFKVGNVVIIEQY